MTIEQVECQTITTGTASINKIDMATAIFKMNALSIDTVSHWISHLTYITSKIILTTC